MIQVTAKISINENHIKEEFARASGPGGQNVNKVSSAVILRFNLADSSLPHPVRLRLAKIAGKKLTADGTLVIKAQRFRTQERNRDDALVRLVEMIREAAIAPKTRIATKATHGSQIRLMVAKTRRSAIKQNRKNPPRTDET